jgi:hypothetical protein
MVRIARAKVLVALGVSSLALSLAGCAPSTDPVPPGSAESASQSPSSPTPPATASPTPEGAHFADCDDMVTDEYLAMMAENGWVGWNMVGEEIGHSPFDSFPGGAPTGQLSCRWGEGPEVATDNVLDLAWAPIDAASARRAQDALREEGFEQIDAPEGTYLALRAGTTDWSDDDGFAETYLFTDTDVRWAQVRSDLAFIRTAPR